MINLKSDKVSIIIPMYNSEEFLKETIQSCINQTYENKEILIIDDASQNNCYSVAKDITEGIEFINVYRNSNNLGLMKTINQAVKKTTGKFLLILGHDDILPDNHISIMMDSLNENTALLHCNSEIINHLGNIIGIAKNDNEQIKKSEIATFELSKDNFISSCGAIISRDAFEQAGGFMEDFKNYGEWMLWIKLSWYGKIEYCPFTKAKYRKHFSNITNTFTTSSVKPELNAYKNDCRKVAYVRIPWSDPLTKLKSKLFYMQINLKLYIKGMIS